MSNTRKLMFSLLTALLLVLTACSTSPEAIKEQLITQAMNNCDEYLDSNGRFANGRYTYRTDAVGRPIQAAGIVVGGAALRDPACQALIGRLYQGVRPPNTDYQGGHLIAAELRGWPRRANLVPQERTFNNGPWKSAEFAAARCREGNGIYMVVNVSYANNTTIIPERMAMSFRDSDTGEIIARSFPNLPGGGPRGQIMADQLASWLIGKGC